jgi:hypothetical protein
MRSFERKPLVASAGALALLLVLAIPAFAATQDQVWRATFKSTTPAARGGSTITVLADGKAATAAVKVYASSSSTVSARICAGACSDSTLLVSFPRFRVPASGVTRAWQRLTTAQFDSLKKALADKTMPTLEVTLSKGTTASTPISATFVKMK